MELLEVELLISSDVANDVDKDEAAGMISVDSSLPLSRGLPSSAL